MVVGSIFRTHTEFDHFSLILATITLVQVPIISAMDYCSSLLIGVLGSNSHSFGQSFIQQTECSCKIVSQIILMFPLLTDFSKRAGESTWSRPYYFSDTIPYTPLSHSSIVTLTPMQLFNDPRHNLHPEFLHFYFLSMEYSPPTSKFTWLDPSLSLNIYFPW